MSDARQAGEFELIKFIIKSPAGKETDLKNIVHTFTISESMASNGVHGSASIYDSTGLLYEFPLVGEEEITIETRDWYGTSRSEQFIVYAITDVRPAAEGNDNVLEFQLNFVSIDSYESNKYFVRKSLDGLVSGMAGTLFDEFYIDPSKEIRIETTSGFQDLVVPYMRPDAAMNFLARKAYSTVDKSSLFRFYENRDRFAFSSPGHNAREYPKDIPKFIYNSYADNTPEGQARVMESVVSIDYGAVTNTADALRNGKYNADVIEVDIHNRRSIHNQYRYMDEYQEYTYPDNDEVTTRNSKEYMERMSVDPSIQVVLQDWGDSDLSAFEHLKGDTNFGELYAHKTAAYHHYSANMIDCVIYGRNDIVAGDYINIDLYKFMKISNDVIRDDIWSGAYVIESIDNVFYEHTYTQKLRISKSGVLGAPATANTDPYVLNNRNADISIANTSAWVDT